jgi:hypothetical protein
MHLSNNAAIVKAAGGAAFSVQVCMRHLCEHSFLLRQLFGRGDNLL